MNFNKIDGEDYFHTGRKQHESSYVCEASKKSYIQKFLTHLQQRKPNWSMEQALEELKSYTCEESNVCEASQKGYIQTFLLLLKQMKPNWSIEQASNELRSYKPKS